MTGALELECCTVWWGRWLCAAVYISQCKLLDYHSLMSTMSRDHIGLDYFQFDQPRGDRKPMFCFSKTPRLLWVVLGK